MRERQLLLQLRLSRKPVLRSVYPRLRQLELFVHDRRAVSDGTEVLRRHMNQGGLLCRLGLPFVRVLH